MKQVTLNQLNQESASLLTSHEAITVEHQGEVIGVYLPQKKVDQAELQHNLDQLDRLIKKICSTNGLTENEFADLFDLTEPSSHDSDR
ncbi:MAG: hypothetical protein WCD18_05365 [Thermosynechococcaceae cyanobacterium]